MLNKHPRPAMAFMKGVHGNSFSEFCGELVDVDDTQRILAENATAGSPQEDLHTTRHRRI